MAHRRLPHLLAALASACALHGCASPERWRGDEGTAHEIVNRATITLATFGRDDAAPALRTALHEACAVLVFPKVASAGFVVGATGGDGVLLVRDERTGHWHGPAFYSIGEGNVGPQVGLSKRELIVAMRSCAQLDALYAGGSRVRMGSSFALQALDEGASVEMANDLRVFARASGLYVGVALTGTVMRPRPELAAAYYGRPLTPAQILDGEDDERSHEIRTMLEITAR